MIATYVYYLCQEPEISAGNLFLNVTVLMEMSRKIYLHFSK